MGRPDDLISRAAAIEAIGERPLNWTDTPGELQAISDWDCYIAALKSVPAVAAAPVVRCKDCKHSIDYDFSEGQGFCDWSGMIVRENFYCAEGKGREEQKDG